MTTLPSWRPVLAATGASIAVAWFLPPLAAVPLAGGVAVAVLWPVIQRRHHAKQEALRERQARKSLGMASHHPELLATPGSDEEKRCVNQWWHETFPGGEDVLIVEKYRRQP